MTGAERGIQGPARPPALVAWSPGRGRLVAWSMLVTAGAVAADLAVQPRRHPAADQ